MTDPIKAKIVELVPDVVKNEHAVLYTFRGPVEHFIELYPITLAVVLRAIKKVRADAIWQIDFNGMFMERPNSNSWECRDYVGTPWNLEHDNYDQQSEQSKQFIGSLLGV